MIVVRLPPVTHFRARITEWGIALALLLCCAILAQPDDTMLQPQFVVLHRLASETFWTFVCGIIGGGRLVALWFNGGWRPSPYIRAIGAIFSGLFWLAIVLGICASGRTAFGLGAYAVLVIFDMDTVYRATQDARIVWDKRVGSKRNDATARAV